jgi:hypothetical protein
MPKLQPFERKNERKMSNVSHKIYKNTILLLIQKLNVVLDDFLMIKL